MKNIKLKAKLKNREQNLEVDRFKLYCYLQNSSGHNIGLASIIK